MAARQQKNDKKAIERAKEFCSWLFEKKWKKQGQSTDQSFFSIFFGIILFLMDIQQGQDFICWRFLEMSSFCVLLKRPLFIEDKDIVWFAYNFILTYVCVKYKLLGLFARFAQSQA